MSVQQVTRCSKVDVLFVEISMVQCSGEMAYLLLLYEGIILFTIQIY